MFDRAIHSFHRATQLEPNLVDAWLRMGRGFLRYQRWDDARACFLEATKRNGDDPAGWIGYGDALLGLHRDADSLRAYDRATRCPRVEMTREIEPHHGHYARALVEERLGHSVEARTAFHKFLETAHADDPRAVDAQRRLASPPRASVPPKA
jgi:cytochrome c-type biogenesis protein CcmH/NrfG